MFCCGEINTQIVGAPARRKLPVIQIENLTKTYPIMALVMKPTPCGDFGLDIYRKVKRSHGYKVTRLTDRLDPFYHVSR